MALNCSVCGSDRITDALIVDDTTILQCDRCGLRFWSPPEAHRAEDVYDAGYFDTTGTAGYDDYASLEPTLRVNFARRIRALGAPPPGGRLLDVGAGLGFAVDEATRAGWRAHGVEITRDAARSARRGGQRGEFVVSSALALGFADERFAAVTLWDVLEHLPDPHRACAEAARVLMPGGILALTTGDVGSIVARLSRARWHLYTLPEHLYFFSRHSLRELLGAHGLHIERMSADGALYPVGYLLERLSKTLLRSKSAPETRLAGLRRLQVPVNLFDIVTVTARKVGT